MKISKIVKAKGDVNHIEKVSGDTFLTGESNGVIQLI